MRRDTARQRAGRDSPAATAGCRAVPGGAGAARPDDPARAVPPGTRRRHPPKITVPDRIASALHATLTVSHYPRSNRPRAGQSHPSEDNPSGWSEVRIWALPARITDCVGRFRQTPAAADICCMADVYTIAKHGPCALGTVAECGAGILGRSGLDLSASMFAPWLLGCPGTPRQHPVSAARGGYRRTDEMAAPDMFRHRSLPVQR
jgi:hypothetical protein